MVFVDTLVIPVVNIKILKYPLSAEDPFVIFLFSYLHVFVIHIILLFTWGPLDVAFRLYLRWTDRVFQGQHLPSVSIN